MMQVKSFSLLVRLSFVLFLCTTNANAFRFVVYSDCRAPKGDASKPFPNNLYNEEVLTFINAQVTSLSPVPEFVMVLGDMVNFASPNAGPDTAVTNNLTYWKNFMTSTLNGIRLYVCVGNSDLYGQTTWWTEEDRQKEYAKVFKDMPNNGPNAPVDFRRLVYAFEYGSGREKALFVVLDSFGIYGTGSTATHCDNDIDLYPYPQEQINWFSRQIKASTATNKFIFSHGPAFSVVGYPVARNIKKVWDLAVENKCDAFFCAHKHLYYRWLIGKEAYPTAPGQLTQILTGTAGAIPDSPANIAANPDGRICFNYNFVVVDVNVNNITMQTYGVTKNNDATYFSKLIDIDVLMK